MTENPNRQPKGTPVGGQFATTGKAESGVSLGGPSGAEASGTFEVTVHGLWGRNEVPPRCRNPRYVTHETSAVVEVRRVSPEQAPVGIEVAAGCGIDQVRAFDGNLYEPYRQHPGQTEPVLVGSVAFPGERRDFYAGAGSEAEFAAEIQGSFDRYLVVGEQVWVRTGEPRYVVQTFGLGHNHGGTGLFTANHDNPNIAAENYFRADEFEAARAHAIAVAEERGDTEFAARLRDAEPEITVHDPSVLRLFTADREDGATTEARDHYRSVAADYARLHRPGETPSAEQEAAVWAELVDARARLLAHTDDVLGVAAHRRPYEEGRTAPW